MRIISYRSSNQHGIGIMVGKDRVISLHRLIRELPATLREILEQGTGVFRRIAESIKGNEGDLHLDQIQLDPVIPEPHATWALALNFQMHIDETGLTTSPDHPQIFQRMP